MSEKKATHSPDVNMLERFDVYLYKNIFSIAVLKKSSSIEMKAFEHTHEEYEFILPITPIPGLTNEGAIYFGEPGFIYPVNTGRRHGLSYPLYDVSHNDICINKEYFEKLVRNYCNGELKEFNSEYVSSRKLYEYIEFFKKKVNESYSGKDIEMESIVNLICYEIIDCGLNPNKEGRHKVIESKDDLKKIADYLVINCTEELMLDEICEKYGISRTYFTKKFAKAFGMPPYQYMMRARISKAKMMLEFEDISITEIAKKCGFLNLTSFSTAFRKRTKTSPEQYRKEKNELKRGINKI